MFQDVNGYKVNINHKAHDNNTDKKKKNWITRIPTYTLM